MSSYEDVRHLGRELSLTFLDSGIESQICDALLSIAYYEEWSWAQDVCLKYLVNENSTICSLAATCLGHIARIHRRLDKDRVIRAIQNQMHNQKIAGALEDAIGDIRFFVK